MADRAAEDPARRPRGRNRDLFAALASGFVGALALASSIYNVYLQRQQVRAQVLPVLEWGVHWQSDDNTWRFVVSNRGVGPATVKRMRVSVDGVPRSTWLDAEKALVGGTRSTLGVTRNAVATLSPGQEVTSFAISDEELSLRMFVEHRRLGAELCYCSTLDDCWIVGGQGVTSDAPSQASDCAPDPRPFRSFDEKALDEVLETLMPDASPGDGSAAKDR